MLTVLGAGRFRVQNFAAVFCKATVGPLFKAQGRVRPASRNGRPQSRPGDQSSAYLIRQLEERCVWARSVQGFTGCSMRICEERRSVARLLLPIRRDSNSCLLFLVNLREFQVAMMSFQPGFDR